MWPRPETTAEVGDRLREAEALLSISTTVNSTLEVTEALRRICREVALLLEADTAAAYLHDRRADVFVPVAGYHVPRELLDTLLGAAMPLGEQALYTAIWRDRRPVLSDDVAADPRFGHELFRRFRHQSALILPLVLDEQVAGAFYLVWWTRRRQLSPREQELVDTIIEQVSVLLRNAARFDKAERERSQLEIMYELARRLAAVQDTDQLLSLLVTEAAAMLDTEAAGIRLVEGDDLVVAARTGLAAAVMARDRIKVGESLSGLVVSGGEPVAVEDLASDTRYDPAHKRGAIERGFHGYLGVPLRLQGRVIGVLNVYAQRRRRFAAEDVSLLTALADQASLAIHKARLLTDAETARAVVERLARVAVSIQAATGSQERLRAFTRGVHDAVGFDRISVLLLSADRARLELAMAFGEEDSGMLPTLPFTPAIGPLFHAMSTGQPIAVLDDDDLARAPAVDAAYARHQYLRTRRFVAVPLVAGGRAMGVAVADNKRSRRPIPAASLEPLSLLCQQLASAVEEARLNAESRTREQEVRKLYEVTSQLASNLDVDWIFDHITSRALDLFGSDAAGIYTYDAARGGLVFRRGANLDDRLTRDLVLRPGEGVGGRAYLDRRPVWTRDRLADPSLRYTPASGALVAECAPRAYLAVPIAIRGEVLGVLVGFFFAPHDFTPREVQLLTTLAGHAAIALDNARLYEETRTQQTRLSQIFDSTSDGFVLVGRQGRIEAANRRAGELLGIDAAGALGRDMSEALSRGDAAGIDAEALAALCSAAVDADREAEGELHLRARQRVVLWAARPTRSASGAAVGVTLTFRDVTREREVSDMKSDFVSFVTHQLRTPLAGIKWMLELAAEDPALPADAASYVEDAREAAQRLIDLVNDLLDISRLERGKLTVEPVPVRLGDLTQSVLDETALILRDKGHVVSVSGGDAAPAVLADVQLLRQVVLNLTSNAIKYTPAGGAIAIAMRPEAGRVTWAITDNGIGIPGASRARLFEKFYRADNAAAVETEGTGLGLYLVRLILEHLGGHIQCESTEGQGSTFTLTLPVAP